MEVEKLFLMPKLVGQRFDDHTIPVRILEDFSALEELIFELAKRSYIERNQPKKRVPKGFTDNVYLKLVGISEGSAVANFGIGVVSSLFGATTPAHEAHIAYFEHARDTVLSIMARANTEDTIEGLDTKFLDYFNRIGRNLQTGEYIEFMPPPGIAERIVFTKDTRKKILLSRDKDRRYSEQIHENILISSIDKKNRTFKFEIKGIVLESPLYTEFQDTIFLAFEEYEKRTFIAIQAIGIFNADDRLVGVEHIENMDILDPFDVGVRLNELSYLPDNWYNGQEGTALYKEGLLHFKEYFSNYFHEGLPLPAIFPTLQGNIVLEWQQNSREAHLEVVLKDIQAATLTYFDTADEVNVSEVTLDLTTPDGWSLLNTLLQNYIHEAHNPPT